MILIPSARFATFRDEFRLNHFTQTKVPGTDSWCRRERQREQSKMLKPDLQHQFWVTKKAVQRKLGSKEDECIVSSDAELDSKIDLLKSIGDSCSQLKRIIDSYQEKMLILAQEENAAGVFLKESGKHSATCSRVMCCAGKSISYSGQQHMKLRAPIVRLHHEVDTFTGRAIKDTYGTVQVMERERTEYRAALGWMKAASAQLDPDKGHGLDKFRNAQMYVRTAKTKFDTKTLDCLQKVRSLARTNDLPSFHDFVSFLHRSTYWPPPVVICSPTCSSHIKRQCWIMRPKRRARTKPH